GSLFTERAAASLGAQQTFVEAAKRSVRRDEMGFDDPVAFAAEGVGIAEARRIGGTDALVVLFAGPCEMRKLTDGVAGDPAAENVAARLGGGARERVKRSAADVGIGACVRAGFVEDKRQRRNQGVAGLIISNRVGLADVGLPFAEHWPK